MATPPLSLTLDAPLANLATGAAHDLRNVLLVIEAHCERLLSAFDSSDPRAEEVRAISDAVSRGAGLASQLVTSAREQDRLGPIDVNDVIRGIEPLVRRLVGEQVTVTTALSRVSWPVTANAVQLEQVVMNLAVNARDAMPCGGQLVIATENRVMTGAGAGPLSQSVVISVTDTGVGIDPEVQERIFEPYFTTKGASGTGVGLATVRAIALLNGGHIELSTSPGEGTTLRVVLPRAYVTPEVIPAEGSVGPVTGATPGDGKRILLVENERAIREFLQRCLAAEGYEVQVASSGAEALDLCDPSLSPVDLVVTDVNLPDINGPDVASRLREQWPGVGVVFMSGGAEALNELRDRGRFPVLAKPFTTSELVRAVRAVLSTGRAA